MLTTEMQTSIPGLLPRDGRRARRSVDSARLLLVMGVRLADVGVVALAGLLACLLRFPTEEPPGILVAGLLLGILLAAHILPLFRLYDLQRLARLDYQLPRLLAAWSICVGAVLVFGYATHTVHGLSRLWIGYWFLAGALGLTAARLLLKHALVGTKLKQLRHRVAVIGDAASVDGCVARLSADAGNTQVDLAMALERDLPLDPGELDEIERRLSTCGIDQVVLASSNVGSLVEPIVQRLRHLPIKVAWAPEVPSRGLPVLGVSILGGQPMVRLVERPIDGWHLLLKDVLDRSFALLALIVAAPLLLAIAAAIRLTSPGPVFYRQVRHGFNREPINVLKFRSMHVESCDRPDAAQVQQARIGDPRITPIGRFLRRTSLDELPQLVNVLKGEMSLVGPRPHALAHDSFYGRLIDDYLGRHRVKPGITGWAQVNGHRGETDTLEKMKARIEHDMYYIKNWSLLLDLKILLRTFRVGFVHAEAR